MILSLSLIKKIDWLIVTAIILLALFGLAAIYSVALGQGLGEFYNFQKQLVWLFSGIVLMLMVANIDYRLWRRFGWLGYGLAVILLILVLTPLGSTIRGSRGWFDLGFFSFQPVELMKLFLIVVLADIYTRYARTIHTFAHLIVVGIIILLPLGLVIIQPDFGSAMILFFTWLISFILVSKNPWHLVTIILFILTSLVISWFFIFADYQKDRLRTFINPALDPLGRGYNVQQSIIAVGAGGFMGRGLGFGSQSQLKFIPESQTDFVFAVIAEEMGLVGVALLLAIFGFLFYRLYILATRAPDDFGMFIVILTIILLFVHVFINIGMGVGLLPVTGISLPFVSYGGSFLLVVLILIGICLNIYGFSLSARKY